MVEILTWSILGGSIILFLWFIIKCIREIVLY